jgi:hypothetical protein
MAGEFRAAWEAALGQAFGGLEQVALDRAINGEVETIERDGMVIAERRRPCSDRLLIHLLKQREKRMDRAASEREAAHVRALAEARLAAFKARAAPAPAVTPDPSQAPPPPALPDAAAAEAAALDAFAGFARAFVDWSAQESATTPGVLPAPGPPVTLAPADGAMQLRMPAVRWKRVRPERVPAPETVSEPAPCPAAVYDRFRPHGEVGLPVSPPPEAPWRRKAAEVRISAL